MKARFRASFQENRFRTSHIGDTFLTRQCHVGRKLSESEVKTGACSWLFFVDFKDLKDLVGESCPKVKDFALSVRVQ